MINYGKRAADDGIYGTGSCRIFVEETGIEYDDAMHTIYGSEIYEKLMDAETGLYRESLSYVYGLLQDEIRYGHIVQAEV